MSSNTLSAVLEKLIQRLCLNDFPCGYGSWRKTKDSAGAEETDTLLDLLNCPHSPWHHVEPWSPQAAALRQLAVLTPHRLRTDFIYSYFTSLRIVDKSVSVVDSGLLRFSQLEELVLSANKISEIPVENLPSTLKILELRANCLSALNSLTSQPPPRLQYLGLSSNNLGSHEDVTHLTGRHWPQLVCLDLSDCEFQDQPTLLHALSTLPCLKTLVLEGNPFTLAPSYPGFTVDSLPQLSCLDASWISPEERHRFRGLAEMTDLIVGQASVTVRVGRMRGIPDPLSVDENAPDFPVITYTYFITYEFLSHQTPVNQKADIEHTADAAATANGSGDADLHSVKNGERQMCKPDPEGLTVRSEEPCYNTTQVSRHSTSKLTWSENMDFSDTQTYTVSNLAGLKKFFSQGLYLKIEEEKVLSWPAASEDLPVAKPRQNVKEKKGKESPIKSGSIKDKSKGKKKKSLPYLVHDAPIRRILGPVHAPLQTLVKESQKVDILCDFGTLHTESVVEAKQALEKDLGKKIKKDKKKDDKESKGRGGSDPGQKNTASSEDKGKGRKVEAHTINPVSLQLEPVTVELSVALEKWQSAAEARHILQQQQTP
uniref:leucine-rich repeat-containing protein 43 isoform X2 n=1 Tax=Monopterus albus TaxID=43700 RepID=UPI0009B43602|nr:leucine-rich repeat-containing protein 43 isoform X2 [Monopterus albus]